MMQCGGAFFAFFSEHRSAPHANVGPVPIDHSRSYWGHFSVRLVHSGAALPRHFFLLCHFCLPCEEVVTVRVYEKSRVLRHYYAEHSRRYFRESRVALQFIILRGDGHYVGTSSECGAKKEIFSLIKY